MIQNRIVLKDGTEIIDGYASKSSRNQLMVRVPGSNIAEAAVTFSNPEKTETIVCYHSIYKTTYTGYMDMYTVQYFESDGYIEIWLKPVDPDHTSTEEEIIVPKEYVPGEVGEEN